MKEQHKKEINDALRELNSTLYEECIATGLITIEQWNEAIAPKLSLLHMAIEEIRVTARTYRLNE